MSPCSKNLMNLIYLDRPIYLKIFVLLFFIKTIFFTIFNIISTKKIEIKVNLKKLG